MIIPSLQWLGPKPKIILIALFFFPISYIQCIRKCYWCYCQNIYNLTTSQYLHYYHLALCHYNLLPNWSSCIHTFLPIISFQHSSQNDPFNSEIIPFLCLNSLVTLYFTQHEHAFSTGIISFPGGWKVVS